MTRALLVLITALVTAPASASLGSFDLTGGPGGAAARAEPALPPAELHLRQGGPAVGRLVDLHRRQDPGRPARAQAAQRRPEPPADHLPVRRRRGAGPGPDPDLRA